MGNDLSPSESQTVEQHVAVCPCCQRLARNLTDSSDVLNRFSEGCGADCSLTVWHDVAARLSEVRRAQSVRHGMMAGASVTAVMLAGLAFFLLPDGTGLPSAAENRVIRLIDEPRFAPTAESVPVFPDPTWQALRRLQNRPQRMQSREFRQVNGL